MTSSLDVTPAPQQLQHLQQEQLTNPLLRRLDRFASAAGRFQSKAAFLLIAFGLLLILLGYAGASGATVERADGSKVVSSLAQFPYLLSGGILGLALVVLGTGLLVAQRHSSDSAQVADLLRRMVDLQELGSSAAGVLAPDDLQGLVVAGSASYHVPSCRLVEGRPGATYLLPVEAAQRGLLACRVCRPDVVQPAA